MIKMVLPNGVEVYAHGNEEILYLYEEIFDKKMYFRHGIKLENGSTVVDVGANIGIFTLFIHYMYPDSRIYSIEPIPPIYEILKANTCNFTGIKSYNVGISDHIGETEFCYFPTMSLNSVQLKYRDSHKECMKYGLLNHYKEKIQDINHLNRFVKHVMLSKIIREQIYSCPLITISELVNREKIQHIDLLKIDVEESEFEVLAGVDDSTWAKVLQIVMEVHNINEEQVQILNSMFRSKGFKVYIDAYEEPNIYYVYAIKNTKEQSL